MNITKEQWEKILSIVLAAAIAIAAVLGWNIALLALQAQKAPGVSVGSQALRERIALDTPTDSWMWNGAKVLMYSDNHATEKVRLDGAVGDLTLARTLTVTNLISQSVGFSASGAIIGTNGLSVSGGITSTNHISAASVILTGDLTGRALTLTGQITTNAVYLGANAFTGPARMISATISNDTFVAHGFSGVQPKILCTPFAAGLFTYTVWISATNSVSFSVGIGNQVTNGPGVGSWVVNCIAQP